MIIFLGNTYTIDLFEDFIDKTRHLPDVVVSCQYPFKIPPSLLEKFTVVNIHFGKLPEYAGCRPVYWQILQEKQAGVTLHYVDEDWDKGDIIDIKLVEVDNKLNHELYYELALEGKKLLQKHFQTILTNTAPRQKQDLSKRKYYPRADVNHKKCLSLGEGLERKLQAHSFEGKQYPRLLIGERIWRLTPE